MASKTIFEVLSDYHRSLDNMRGWLDEAPLGETERMGVVDAWQQEMLDYFQSHGYCFACNRPLGRCRCDEPPANDLLT
jgi:hypothetical protein